MREIKVNLTSVIPDLVRKRKVPEWLIVVLLFSLALASRLYMLDTFPDFPREFPWLGEQLGLYRDEVGYLNLAQSFRSNPTAYQPWLQIAAVTLSIENLGLSAFSVRLPSALISSLTILLVYFTSKELFKSRTAAVFSALFLTAMVPAVVYNRMLFLENFVAFFFLATLYAYLRYESGTKTRWLYLASLMATLAALSKINGATVIVFLALLMMFAKPRPKTWKPILIPVALVGAFLIFVILTLPSGIPDLLRMWWIGVVGREISTWQFLILQSLPSGFLVTVSEGFVKPELWFLYAYFGGAILLFKNTKNFDKIIVAFFSFIMVMTIIWGAGSYFIILLFPFMALMAGYGTLQMLKMTGAQSLLFVLVLYLPLVSLTVATLAPALDFNFALYAFRLALVGLVLIPLIAVIAFRPSSVHKVINAYIIIIFFMIIINYSYLTPSLYPHFFR